MNILDRLKKSCQVPIEFCRTIVYKLSHHNGKFSYFKTAVFISAFLYLLTQPLNIIRSALASSFVGYILNTFSNTVLDSAIEVSE